VEINLEAGHILKAHEKEFEVNDALLFILDQNKRVICVLEVGKSPWD
jgi:hypothetical protein